MPLYDCMLLLKPQVNKELMMNLVARVGKHVYARNGVITELKYFNTVQLGYGIKKKHKGTFYQGKLMQMTMMATPNINKELHYLNNDDSLLRWILVKHRDIDWGKDYWGETIDSQLGKRTSSKSEEDENKENKENKEFVGELYDDDYEVESSEKE